MNKTVDNPQFHTEKIAIVLATYNGAEYLKEQLDSLLAQTNRDWITYIHDDGSTDDTAAVIDEYVAKYPQKFVKIEGKSTGGAKQNFFYLLSAVDAPYLMWKRETNEIVEVTEWKDFNFLNKKNVLYAMNGQWNLPNYIHFGYSAEKLCEEYEAGNLKGKLKEIASKLKFDDNLVLVLCKLK